MGYTPENNYYQAQTSTGAGIGGTTLLMAGTASLFTPKSTGKILIIISGDAQNTVSINGAGLEILYGTGTAPSHGAALTGTLVGTQNIFGKFTGNSKYSSFALQGVVTGLTVGTAYWFDLAVKENTTGTGSVTGTDISVSILELEANTSTYQASPTNPGTSSSTTFLMGGLAGSITPNNSGKLHMIVSGNFQSTSATGGIELKIKYGTGTAPTSGALDTGTLSGRINHIDNPLGANSPIPFSLQGIVSGLVVGTTYWVDIAQSRLNTSSTYSITNVSLTVLEL